MSHSPFSVLGIPATLDPNAVKRAYFACIARHPPHQDAEAFRRVRAAYEALTAPGGLAAAYLQSPLDWDAALAPYRTRLETPLAQASEAIARERGGRAAVERFVNETSRMTFEEWIRS
jgi:curved DNA-binding protein CbpA